MSLLLPAISTRYGALVELTGSSALLENRLRPSTAELNAYPLCVNKKKWETELQKAEENANFLNLYCCQLADDNYFRANSSSDVRKALLTKESDEDTLAELQANGNLLAGAVLDARSQISRLSQLKAWAPFAEEGKVQATWDSLGTPHGRYSCDSPCLTNRIEPIRETIVADPGYSFISMDLSQCEYATWASLSGDTALIRMFQQGRDFHIEMAKTVKNLCPAWNPDDLRQAGKLLNFAILYQMTPYALARKLNCSVDLATEIIRAYYRIASSGQMYVVDQLARAECLGYVTTYFGRKRHCEEYAHLKLDREIHQMSKTLFHHVNAGTAAEIVKWKQVRCWEALRREGFHPTHIRLAINLFDELIWLVRDDLIEDAQDVLEPIWNATEPGFLTFRTTTKIGKTWGEVSK